SRDRGRHAPAAYAFLNCCRLQALASRQFEIGPIPLASLALLAGQAEDALERIDLAHPHNPALAEIVGPRRLGRTGNEPMAAILVAPERLEMTSCTAGTDLCLFLFRDGRFFGFLRFGRFAHTRSACFLR